MAGRNRRWTQCIFPIDDNLIEQLIDECRARTEEEFDDTMAPEDALGPDVDDSDPIFSYLANNSTDEQSDDAPEDTVLDPTTDDDVLAVNMRVLNDYLRRRLIDEPEPIAPTLH